MNESRAAVGRGSLVLLLLAVLSAYAFGEKYTARIETDLDMDGKRERIEIRGGNRLALKVWRGKKLLWQAVPAHWGPWKLEVADVDGDGKKEIVVGVLKSTKFFPVPHNCLFIYGWKDDRGFPKWLGSSLGRTFSDFVFGEAGDLIALETMRDGRKSAGLYRWNGFGFTRERQLGEWRSARLFGLKGGVLSLLADGENTLIPLDESRRGL